MTIRQENTARTGPRLIALGLLVIGGLSLFGLHGSLAQTRPSKTPEEIAQEARMARERAARLRGDSPAARAARLRGENLPPPDSNRPGSMREYNERRNAAAAATQPSTDKPGGPEMKLQAEELKTVSDQNLAELEAKAREEAAARARGASPHAPVTATRPAGMTSPGRGASPVPPPPGATARPGAPQPATPPQPGGPAAAPSTFSPAAPPGADTTGVPGFQANPSFWSLPPEDRPYMMSWKDVPLSTTLQDISDYSGLTVITSLIQPNELTTKKITFQSARTYSYDEMLTTYNTLLFDLNYWVVHRGDYLVIRPLSEWYRHIPPENMYASLEQYRKAKLPKWEVASVVYDPQFALPETLATYANDLVPLNGARAVIEPSSSRIQLMGFVYFIDDQLDILKNYDVKPDDPRPLRTYTLQYTSVEDAARMLRVMLPTASGAVPSMAPTPTPMPGGPRPPTPAGAASAGSSMNDVVEIQEDTRSNRLVIKATPVKHELVQEYLEKYIDLPLDPNQAKAKLFQLKYADPHQIVETIRPLLGTTKPVVVQQPAPGSPGAPRPPGAPPTPAPVVQMTTTVGTSAVIMPFPQSRSVLVKANKDEMVQIEQYIKLLDVEVPQNFEYIKLQHASANAVAGILREVLGSSPRRIMPGGQSPAQVQFQASADPSGDKALVLRGEPQDITDAKLLIKELDVDPEAGAVEHLVQLKEAEPETVAEILRSRYSEGGGTTVRRSYYGYSSYGGGGGGSSLPRFIPESRSKTLIVVATEEMWPDIERLIRDLDERSHTRNVTRIYRLKYASPSNMVDILSQAFGGMSGGGMWGRRSYYGGGQSSDAPSFQYDPNGDALVITASEELHEKALQLISELDQPSPADKAQPRPIQLVKADAEYVAGKIEDMFQEDGGRRSRGYYNPYSSYGRGGSDELNKIPVRVVAEEITNRVFVTASDEDFKKAEDLARSIDAEYEKQEIIRKTFVLEHADPSEMRNILESMFEDAGGGSRRSSRRRGYGGYGGYDYGGYDYGGRSRSSVDRPGAIRLIDTLDSIIVMAPKDKMEQIEKVIKELDTDSSGSNQIKTYKVESVGYEGTAGIARNLSDLFGESSGRGGYDSSGRQSRGRVKFVGEYGSDILLVSAPANRMAEIDQKVQEILKLKTSTDLSFTIKHFDVDRARPEDLAEIIEPVLESKFEELQQKSGGNRYRGWFGGGNSPRVTAHKSARKIMVSAPEPLMPLVGELLKEFDRAPEPSTTKIVVLKTGKAGEIASAVEQMMDKSSSGSRSFRSRGSRSWFPWGGYSSYGGAGSSDEGDLQITAIESSNLVMLKGPIDKVAEAEKLIQELDEQATGDGPILMVKKIEYADLYEVAEMIEEMVGGSSYSSGYGSSYGSRRSRSGGSEVVVKTDYTNNSLIISASRDKIPMIEEIIKMKDREPPKIEDGVGGQVVSVGGGEIAKRYDIKKGDVNETAKQLDRILLSIYGFDAPYVKAFPFANQIIVTGKPEHFKEVELWLAKFEEKPIEARYVVLFKPVEVSPMQVITYLRESLPADQREQVVIQPVPGLRGRNPLQAVKERKWDDPIVPTTQPAASAFPFVPTNELNELRAAVLALSLVQVTPATQPAATQPAAVPATRPAAPAKAGLEPGMTVLAKPSTKPAAVTTAAAGPAKPSVPQTKATDQQVTQSAAPSQAGAPAPSVGPTVEQAAAPGPESPAVEDTRDARTREQETLMETAFQARESKKVQIRYDEQKKVIYIVGPAQEVEAYQQFIEDIEDQIKKMQGEAEVPSDIRVFELSYIDVNIAAAILEQMFNDKPGTPGQPQPRQPRPTPAKKPGDAKEGEDEEGSARRRREEQEAKEEEETSRKGVIGGQRIRVFADARTRTIIVRAAEEDFPAVAELILKIDRPGEGVTQEIRVFQLKKLNAYDVEMAIKAVLKIEDSRMRMGMMGSPFGRMSRMGRMAGMGGADAEAMIEQLQAQMMQIEMQASLAAAQAGQPEQPGVESEGKQLKLNPSKDISLTSDATTNTIIVTAPKEGIALVQKLIDTLEEQTIPVQIKSFPIKHGDAEQVAGQLERLFQGGSRGRSRGGRASGGMPGMAGFAGGLAGFEDSRSGEVRIASDTRTNTLIVRALEPDMSKIEELIAQIDQEELTGKVILYPVENGNAADIARSLGTIFEGSTGRGGSGGQAIRIAADANTNTIMVWAPEAAQKQIGEKIQEIDRQGALPYKPREIKLTFASATAVADKLEAIYLGAGGRARGATNRVKIEGDDTSGTVFVTAPEELFKQIEATIKTLDQPGKIDIRVYPLKHAYASQVIIQFKEMTTQLAAAMRGRSGGGTGAFADEAIAASADSRTNSIIVTGSPAAHLIVEKVLKQIDKPPDVEVAITTAMFGLTKSNAAAVAQSINALYASVQLPAGVPKPVAVAEPSSNVVFVYATKSQLDNIKASIITPLEDYKIASDIKERVFPVKYLNVDELAAMVTQYINSRNQAARAAGMTVPPADLAFTAVADSASRQLLVSSGENNINEIETYLKEHDTPEAAGMGRQVRVFPLKYANVAYTVQAISQAFQPTGRVSDSERVIATAEYSTQQVVVRANAENMKKVEELINSLDKSDDDPRQMRPYAIKYADLNSIVAAINQNYAASNATKPRREQVVAVAEPGTFSVLVTASEENHKIIQKLIEDVDKPDTGRQNFSIEVAHADPEDVVAALQDIYTASRTSRGRLPATFTIARGTRKIMISSTPTEFEEIKKLVAELDAEDANASRDTRVIQVRHITPEEMNTILTEFMRRPGQTGRYSNRLLGDVKIMTSSSAGAVVITGPKERLDELEQLAMKVDLDKGSKEGGRQIYVVTLKNADPSSVAPIINQAYQKTGQVAEADRVYAVSEWTTNSVVITATEAKMQEIQKMIDELDQKPTAGRQAHIPLQHARAEDLATVLQRTYQGSRRRSGDMPITIAADANTNSLVVSANPADIEGIKQMVVELDKPATLPEEELRIVPLKYIDATETLQIMTEYLRKPGVARGGQSQALAGDVRLQASATMNAIIISGTEAQIKHVESKLQAMDQEVEGAGAPKMIQLKHASANQVAQTLTRMFTENAQQRQRGRQAASPDLIPVIVPDEGTNSLLVRARQVDYLQIVDLADKLDKEVTQSAFRIIPLQPGVDVEWWAREIERTVNQTEQNKARQLQNYKPRQVTIGVDYRGPAFMVGGDPGLFDQVDQLVQGLINVRRGGFGETAVIVRPQNGNMDTKGISQLIKNFYDQRNGNRRGR